MEDPTGLVKNVQLTIRGLPSGEYAITAGETSSHAAVAGPLNLSVPVTAAATIRVEKRQSATR